MKRMYIPEAALKRALGIDDGATVTISLVSPSSVAKVGGVLQIDIETSAAATVKRPPCDVCGGDGYYKGPRLGDEACPSCEGTGKAKT